MAIGLLAGRDVNEKKLYDWFIQDIANQLKKMDPASDVRVWPELGDVSDIDLVFAFRHPLGILKTFPNLKCIASLAAGVDHLLVDPLLPKKIPVLRVMDPAMANDIVQYVLAYVLLHVKRIKHWEICQAEKIWAKQPPFDFSNKTIGIMGLGFLGKKIASALTDIGLQVIGWSNSKKTMLSIKNYEGKKELPDFLSQTDILVCMLPFTPRTENILNHETFSQLKKGACLINLGRGEHLVERDLIESLDAGQLSAACLDVFREEPLPLNHAFWTHPKICVTPHIASVTRPETAVPYLMDSYHKVLVGEQVENRVDVARGY